MYPSILPYLFITLLSVIITGCDSRSKTSDVYPIENQRAFETAFREAVSMRPEDIPEEMLKKLEALRPKESWWYLFKEKYYHGNPETFHSRDFVVEQDTSSHDLKLQNILFISTVTEDSVFTHQYGREVSNSLSWLIRIHFSDEEELYDPELYHLRKDSLAFKRRMASVFITVTGNSHGYINSDRWRRFISEINGVLKTLNAIKEAKSVHYFKKPYDSLSVERAYIIDSMVPIALKISWNESRLFQLPPPPPRPPEGFILAEPDSNLMYEDFEIFPDSVVNN